MKKHFVRMLLLLIAITIAGCGGGGSTTANENTTTPNSVILHWNAPATRNDGTYLGMSEIAGYKVYMGPNASSLTLVSNISDPYTMEYEVNNLDVGTYYFSVSTYDTDNLESDMSGVVSKTI